MNAGSEPNATAAAPLPPLAEGTYCPDCGYDLRGSSSLRCPECGHDLTLLRTTESLIPWVHRRQIGWLRAYVRTAWLVTFHNRRFCAEAARAVSYADAQRFRWVTVAIAYLTLVLARAVCWWLPGGTDAFQVYQGLGWIAVPAELGGFLALAAITGLPSYFFHPRYLPTALQDRAIALSYYTCAPLGFIWSGFILAAMIHGCESPTIERYIPDEQLLFSGNVLNLGLVALWWFTLIRTGARVVRQPARTWLIAVGVPLLWVIVGGAVVLGIPFLGLYVGLMVYAWP